MNPMRLIHLQKFIELEFLIILLFEAYNLHGHARLSGLLGKLTQPDSLFCYEQTVHARFKVATSLRCWGCCLARSRK